MGYKSISGNPGKGPFIKYGWGGPEDFRGGPPIFSQALKGGPLSFSRGQ